MTSGKAEGGVIHLNSPVTKIKWLEETSQFEIHYDRVGANKPAPIIADYRFSNIAIPFLKELVEDGLQNPEVSNEGFSNDFKAALDAVYVAQFSEKIKECEDGKWVEKPRTASKKF